MSVLVDAVYDGEVLRPSAPLALAPNTRVRISIEQIDTEREKGKPNSFLDTARALKLDGPPDWATNIHSYLYGNDDP